MKRLLLMIFINAVPRGGNHGRRVRQLAPHLHAGRGGARGGRYEAAAAGNGESVDGARPEPRAPEFVGAVGGDDWVLGLIRDRGSIRSDIWAR